MARSRRTRRQSHEDYTTLREKGIRASILGLAFLIIPAMFGTSLVMQVVKSGLSIPGWFFFGAGVLMLGIDLAKRKSLDTPTFPPIKPTKLSDQDKRDLTAKIFRHAPMQADKSQAKGPWRETIESTSRAGPKTGWSPAVFAAIEWRRFEAVCEALFAQAGFQTRSQSHDADGGVDIWLHSANAQGPVSVVQCKHWQSKPVGVKEMREFFGVMSSHQLKRGTYATTSTYTADAQQFAKANGIHTLDGPALLALIAKRSPEQQQVLLGAAFEGEYWRPTCASCGIKLVERKPAKGGAAFWGCSNYPKCRTTFKMTAPI